MSDLIKVKMKLSPEQTGRLYFENERHIARIKELEAKMEKVSAIVNSAPDFDILDYNEDEVMELHNGLVKICDILSGEEGGIE